MSDIDFYDITNNDIQYIEQKTNLKHDRILRLFEKFLQTYPLGLINETEFKTILKRVLLNTMIDDSEVSNNNDHNIDDLCDRIFRLCDNDSNGYVDFKEYLVLFWCRANGTLCDKLDFVFKLFDSNNNDTLDFHELHTIVRILYKLKENEFESFDVSYHNNNKKNHLTPSYYITFSIMKKFDLNRDGLLSKDEFIQGCLDHQEIRQFLTPLSIFLI